MKCFILSFKAFCNASPTGWSSHHPQHGACLVVLPAGLPVLVVGGPL